MSVRRSLAFLPTILVGLSLGGLSCGDEGGSTELSFTDSGSTGSTTGDASVAGDVDEPKGDLSGSTDGESTDGDQPAPDVDGPPEDQTAEVCSAYCGKLVDCGQPYGSTAGCPKDCAEQIEKDEAWANSYLCATVAQCQQMSGCTSAPIPTADTCVDLCGKAQGCDIFPSSALGGSQDGCVLSCSIQVKYNLATWGPFMECADEKLASCSDAELLSCNTQLDDGLCQVVCNGGQKEDGSMCNVVPANFDDLNACLKACDGYTSAQKWTARFCVSQGPCDSDDTGCFPPPTELLPGAAAFCAKAWELCGGTEGYNLPKDTDVCGWIMGGVVMGAKGGLKFEGSLECLDGYEACPGEAGVLYGCLVEENPACDDYCTILTDCGAPQTSEVCHTQCNYAFGSQPELIEPIVNCVTTAPGCVEVGGCFNQAGGEPDPG